jgi:hypothetical protein
MSNTEQVAAAVANGDIREEQAEVTVSAKASPDGKEHKRGYTALRPQSFAGMLALCNGKVEPSTPKPEGKDERTADEKAAGACDYFDYAYDLEVRAKIRAQIIASLDGPDKAIAKAIAGLTGLLEAGLMEQADFDTQVAKIRAAAANAKA